MPKIDWLGDDYQRYEPRLRLGRPRRMWPAHRERDRDLRDYYALTTEVFPPLPAPQAQRRPLHLIWGEAQRDPQS